MGRGSPPATDEQKIEFVSPSPSPAPPRPRPRRASPPPRLSPARPPRFPAPLCLAHRWRRGLVAPRGCLVPGAGHGLPQLAALDRRRKSRSPSRCLPHPEPRGLQITLDRGPSQESRPKDLLFSEIFRFSGHPLALPGVRCAPGLNKMLWC